MRPMGVQNYFEPNESRTTPIIKGTSVSLLEVLDRLAAGATVDEVAQALPNISREQVIACLHFSSELVVEAYTEKLRKWKVVADRIRKLKINPIVLKDADGNVIDLDQKDV